MVYIYGILFRRLKNAGVAQLVEQLICNQQVGGSSPSTSSSVYESLVEKCESAMPQARQTFEKRLRPSTSSGVYIGVKRKT